MPVQAGSRAPEFALKDQEGNEVTLADLEGAKALVVFIPFPFSSICEGELCAIRDERARLNDLDANVVAISCDTRHANRKWSEDQGFGFPVLSDFWPHGETCRAYGVFNEKVGAANRITFVLDEDGVVREVIDTGSVSIAREIEACFAALEALR
jgi:peroxiredoxin (alkyl hydroperoxide reductase subunit C)